MQIDELKLKAVEIREKLIDYGYKIGKCHYGGTLSTIDILTTLYYEVMEISPDNPKYEERDRFILSKGHGVLGLYIILADLGFYSMDNISQYKEVNSMLQGHPHSLKTPGIEMTAGSLGQGISYGMGKAIGLKLKGIKNRVYVMVGDGELQEGQNWEAIAAANHCKLNNMVVIVDHNKLQLDDTLASELSYCELEEKFRSFGWTVRSINGHDIGQILRSLKKENDLGPTAIIANTIKGKGISFMENEIGWHCGKMSKEQYLEAKKQLKKLREVI
ncbi:transketolase [Wukongibacter baidiensis]|uniref:transketolase n=1 Tax=Wukongibacter baidiensis TaxID=1723361 RepID=UPI003D7F969D